MKEKGIYNIIKIYITQFVHVHGKFFANKTYLILRKFLRIYGNKD